jgi:hypothetical protein
MATRPICKIDGCGKSNEAHGLCRLHYRRWQRYGDPNLGKTGHGAARTFFETVVLAHESDECLLWPFALNYMGYGKLGGRIVSRLVCRAVYGPPPRDHEAAHSCTNKNCVSARHLRWATHKENEADKYLHGTRKQRVPRRGSRAS